MKRLGLRFFGFAFLFENLWTERSVHMKQSDNVVALNELRYYRTLVVEPFLRKGRVVVCVWTKHKAGVNDCGFCFAQPKNWNYQIWKPRHTFQLYEEVWKFETLHR